MKIARLFLLLVIFFAVRWSGLAQSINSGTVVGSIVDQSGAVVPGATVNLRNAVTGYSVILTTDGNGSFRFNNVPQNNYRLTVTAASFSPATQDVDVRTTVPISIPITLRIAPAETAVTVEASSAQVEQDPSAHQDVDRSTFSKLPIVDPGGSLSQAITFATGAVAADANGFFHPLGDHAQTSFIIDGQTISDQQSKLFRRRYR